MRQNFIDASLNFKTATVDQRVAVLAEQAKHPAYPAYVDFFIKEYGEHPAEVALKDLAWQIETGLDDDDNEPPEGLIHPRYGRIPGRVTYYPFQSWLSNNENQLKAEGLFPEDYALKNMPLIGF